MPLLRVDATAQGPRLHGAGNLDTQLAAVLGRMDPSHPVIVLVHGFKYSPEIAACDPHAHIFSLTPRHNCWKARSWPRHLGFGHGCADEGLCIAFAWEARGSIWRAWEQAEAAGRALADLLTRIRRLHPSPVDMIGHSLGTRVCLSALSEAPAASVGRLVLMAAAEFRGAAKAAVASPAGRHAEVLNIITRENDLFDAMVEWILPASGRGDRTLGIGLAAPRWLDVQIDAVATRAALRNLGYRIPAPKRRICHWSLYLRPGLWPFYRDLLRSRDRLSLAFLRQTLPVGPEPRWTRLVPSVAGVFQKFRSVFRVGKRPRKARLCPSSAPAHRSETASPAA